MRIAVIGLGLIGGSIAKALKARTQHEVFGYDRDPDVLLDAGSLGAIDAVATPETLSACDVVYLCLYPEGAVAYAEQNAGRFGKHCIVTDVCGIKGAVAPRLSALAKKHGFLYIGGHPMAGKETNGFAASGAGLFTGASYILVPEDAPEEALRTLERLAEEMGFGRTVRCSAAEHDRRIAYTSQVPHLLACAYVMSPECADHAGFSAGSYRDVSRVARINGPLWADLFLSNREALLAETDELLRNLTRLREAVARGEREPLTALLEEARSRKERFG